MAAYQQALPRLHAAGIEVLAVSTDPEHDARQLQQRLGLELPVGFGLPLHATAEKIGAFFEERRGILHATGFLLRPDHTVAIGTYSTGAIGRLDAEDVLRLVEFWER